MKNFPFPGFVILLFAWLSIVGCESDQPKPSTIVHRNLDDVRVGYNLPFSLDIDLDGDHEYGFTTGLLGNSEGDHLIFKIVPLRSNGALGKDEKVIKLESGIDILPEDTFEKFVEPLVTKSITANGTSFSGEWKDANDQYIGLKFILDDNKPYYGWIKISFSQEEEKLIVHDFSYQSMANTKITTGQKK
jgi:hypothetical protein